MIVLPVVLCLICVCATFLNQLWHLTTRVLLCCFRFKDWSDYKAISKPLKDLGGNEYQLVKQYVSGSAVYEREITKPVDGTVKLSAQDTEK